MSMEERSKVLAIKDIYIDIGVKDKDEVKKLGIRVGDQVIPYTEFTVMNNKNYLLGKAERLVELKILYQEMCYEFYKKMKATRNYKLQQDQNIFRTLQS